MSGSSILYHLTVQQVADLTICTAQLGKVVGLKLRFRSEVIELFISLAELKAVIADRPQLRYSQAHKLSGLIHLVKLNIQLLLKQYRLKLQLISAEFLPLANSVAELKILTANQSLGVVFYIAKSSLDFVQDQLQAFHQQFMRQDSSAFNQKLNFPMILGEAFISRQELSLLKKGSLIFFDKLNLPQTELSCQIANLQLSLNHRNN